MDRSASFPQWLRQPETLVGLSALLLSLCGLGIALYEASLFRQAQRASVWPHLEVSASIHSQSIRLFVVNSGVGPARVETAFLSYRGEAVDNWVELVGLVRPGALELTDLYQSLLGGRVLAATPEHEEIFIIGGADDSAGTAVAAQLSGDVMRGDLDVSVCYCSVYNECWTTTLQDVIGRFRESARPGGPKSVPHCRDQPRSRI